MPRKAQNKQIDILREKIEDLRGRFPAHSLKPHMLQELEQLEEELEALLENNV